MRPAASIRWFISTESGWHFIFVQRRHYDFISLGARFGSLVTALPKLKRRSADPMSTMLQSPLHTWSDEMSCISKNVSVLF